MLTNPKEIKRWLDKYNIKNYIIRPNGVVDVDDNIYLRSFTGETLPIQFGTTGSFDCSHSNITSFKGFPKIIKGYFDCFESKIISLSGIDKIIKQINGNGSVIVNVPSTHVLGLLLIEGVRRIDVDMRGPIDKIMNKYLGTGDILSAQDELIDAGFTDQARL
jgi:hypothetical protein